MIRVFFLVMSVSIFGSWIIWAVSSATIFEWFVLNKKGLDNPGTWGDSFGALNALFGAFGFLAVLLTLLTQQKALQRQQDDLHRQRFESSFFELLSLLRECRQEVSYIPRMQPPTPTPIILNGIRAFRSAADELGTYADGMLRSKAGMDENFDLRGEFSGLYFTVIHKQSESTISPYFRIVYAILNRIKNDKILTEDERISYGNLLRSQLGSAELSLIGCNGLLELSNEFPRLIEQFRILKYLPEGPIRDALRKLYPEAAFSGRP